MISFRWGYKLCECVGLRQQAELNAKFHVNTFDYCILVLK